MDELPPHARRLLDVARTLDDPDPQRRARADEAVRDALAAHGMVDLPALTSPATPAAPRVFWQPSLGVKLALGLGVMAVLAAGVWQLRAAREQRPAPSQVQPPAPTAHVPRPAPARPLGPAAGAGAAPVAQPRSKHVAAHKKAPIADDSALRGELRLLAAVDGMLRDGLYHDALRTLGDAARPAVLSEERRALRILALCGLGSSAQAREERAQFLENAPRSVLASRVRAACPSLHETPEP
ncbi:MAG TPA: hypothetical protein VJV78_47855 [Polyangiales bacterium]|nr:hypothetical protein [Polyangiales bacterium]